MELKNYVVKESELERALKECEEYYISCMIDGFGNGNYVSLFYDEKDGEFYSDLNQNGFTNCNFTTQLTSIYEYFDGCEFYTDLFSKKDEDGNYLEDENGDYIEKEVDELTDEEIEKLKNAIREGLFFSDEIIYDRFDSCDFIIIGEDEDEEKYKVWCQGCQSLYVNCTKEESDKLLEEYDEDDYNDFIDYLKDKDIEYVYNADGIVTHEELEDIKEKKMIYFNLDDYEFETDWYIDDTEDCYYTKDNIN